MAAPDGADMDEAAITTTYDTMGTTERDRAANLCTRLFFYVHNFTEGPVRSMPVDLQLGGGVYDGLAAYRRVHARSRKLLKLRR